MSNKKNELLKVNFNETITNQQVLPVAVEPHVGLSDDEAVLHGPDQILYSDDIVTSSADGRVKLFPEPYRAISIPSILGHMAVKYAHHPALISRPVNGSRKIYDYEQYETLVKCVGKALINFGLKRHHHVAIFGFNSPELFICELAAIYAGGIVSEICKKRLVDESCLDYSKTNIFVVDTYPHLDEIYNLKKKFRTLKFILLEGESELKDVYSWEKVLKIGQSQSDKKLNEILKSIAINECCAIIFPSSSNCQKRIMLSQNNFLTAAHLCKEVHQFKEGSEVIVSYLSLSHMAGQMADLIISLVVAATVHFAERDALKGSLIDTLIFAKPTLFFGVPKVWKKFYEISLAKHINILEANPSEQVTTINNAIKTHLGLERCKLFFTGTKPLMDDIKKYFMSIGIIIINLYGTPECSSAYVFSINDQFGVGCIGNTTAEYRIKIYNPDDNGEGEICIKSPHVFMGYLNDIKTTKEAIDDNHWFHTGHLGKKTDDGFMHITGKIKNVEMTIDKIKNGLNEGVNIIVSKTFNNFTKVHGIGIKLSSCQEPKPNSFQNKLNLLLTRYKYYPNLIQHNIHSFGLQKKFIFTLHIETKDELDLDKIMEFSYALAKKFNE